MCGFIWKEEERACVRKESKEIVVWAGNEKGRGKRGKR